MKNFLQSKICFLFLFIAACALSADAQRKSVPRTIQFDELNKYVSLLPEDSRFKGRIGARFIIPDAPPGRKVEQSYTKNLYIIEYPNTITTDYLSFFVTSPEMTKILRQHLKSNVTFWRFACTIIEYGDDDSALVPYLTKVEGLDKNGAVVWTAIGKEPKKLSFWGDN